MDYPLHYPQFFTATILNWKHLLKPDKYKDIIAGSLAHLVKEKRIQVFGFAIMRSHIHIIWLLMNDNIESKVQQSFMKFTAQMIIKDLRNNHPLVLEHFLVEDRDRKYQIWERNPLSIELRCEEVLMQKLIYIHDNPVKAGLSLTAEAYLYSSASLYITGGSSWNFLEKWEAAY